MRVFSLSVYIPICNAVLYYSTNAIHTYVMYVLYQTDLLPGNGCFVQDTDNISQYFSHCEKMQPYLVMRIPE